MQIQSDRTVPLRQGIFVFFCFQFDRIPVKFPHTTGDQTLGKKLPAANVKPNPQCKEIWIHVFPDKECPTSAPISSLMCL